MSARKGGEFEGVTPPRFNVPERFWSKVDKTSTCWLWNGHKFRDGYGGFQLDGKNQRAHRLAWQWLRGSIEPGMVLDHLCRVRNCVNPDHMEVVTNRENTRRGIGPSAVAARRISCVHGHPFDEANTIQTSHQRVCRECRRQISQRRRDRQKASA
jgi:hypothetical protein